MFYTLFPRYNSRLDATLRRNLFEDNQCYPLNCSILNGHKGRSLTLAAFLTTRHVLPRSILSSFHYSPGTLDFDTPWALTKGIGRGQCTLRMLASVLMTSAPRATRTSFPYSHVKTFLDLGPYSLSFRCATGLGFSKYSSNSWPQPNFASANHQSSRASSFSPSLSFARPNRIARYRAFLLAYGIHPFLLDLGSPGTDSVARLTAIATARWASVDLAISAL